MYILYTPQTQKEENNMFSAAISCGVYTWFSIKLLLSIFVNEKLATV